MSIVWTIMIGFLIGIVAKFIMPYSRFEPSGFILTALLCVVGAVVATYLGQTLGLYGAGESAGFFGAVVGAIVVMVVWGLISKRIESK
jgi:uncharacterized membrane protein YeaQ/YmgE (transglycosylase-associated protein family)